jgi:hypothetical protein
MYRKVKNKFQELPPRFFKITAIALILVLIAVPILLKYTNQRIDESIDFNMVIDQYSKCHSCKTFTGEKPRFVRTSYSSSGYSPRKYLYVLNVEGNNQNATIKAELRKLKDSYEIVDWTFTNQDTSIVFN